MRSNTRESKIAVLAARILHRFLRLLLWKVVGVVGAREELLFSWEERELLLGLRYSNGRLSPEIFADILGAWTHCKRKINFLCCTNKVWRRRFHFSDQTTCETHVGSLFNILRKSHPIKCHIDVMWRAKLISCDLTQRRSVWWLTTAKSVQLVIIAFDCNISCWLMIWS